MFLRTVWAGIASVGWYLLAIALSLWWALPHIRERYANWKRKRDEQEYAAKYHKNSDLLQQRLSSLDASRQKMQENYQAKAAIARQQEKEREQKKREALRALERNLDGHRLGSGEDEPSSSTEAKSKSLKSDYNPLMGDGSRGYRPAKRSCCGKGGCG